MYALYTTHRMVKLCAASGAQRREAAGMHECASVRPGVGTKALALEALTQGARGSARRCDRRRARGGEAWTGSAAPSRACGGAGCLREVVARRPPWPAERHGRTSDHPPCRDSSTRCRSRGKRQSGESDGPRPTRQRAVIGRRRVPTAQTVVRPRTRERVHRAPRRRLLADPNGSLIKSRPGGL
jgi:hypothetical protein